MPANLKSQSHRNAVPSLSLPCLAALIVTSLIHPHGSSHLVAQEAERSIAWVDTRQRIEAVLIELDRFDVDSVQGPVDAVAINGIPTLGVLLSDAPLGAEVIGVTAGLAGDRAGLIKGDKIVEIDEADIETPADAKTAVSNHPLASPMHLVYIRNNRRYERDLRFTATESAQTQGDDAAKFRVAELERDVMALRKQVVVLREAVRLLAAEQIRNAE